jgi:hypothetical protein
MAGGSTPAPGSSKAEDVTEALMAIAAEDTVKPQWIRVADVVLIGPLMIAGGVALHRRYEGWGLLLTILGATTIVYNGMNWYRIREGAIT